MSMSMTLCCKDIEVRKSEYVAKTQFLCLPFSLVIQDCKEMDEKIRPLSVVYQYWRKLFLSLFILSLSFHPVSRSLYQLLVLSLSVQSPSLIPLSSKRDCRRILSECLFKKQTTFLIKYTIYGIHNLWNTLEKKIKTKSYIYILRTCKYRRMGRRVT